VFLARNGKLYSWGTNTHYCLGLGDLTDRGSSSTSKPQEIIAPEMYADGGFKDFAAGEHHNLVLTKNSRVFVLARTKSGQIYGWGKNENEELNLGIHTSVATPTLSPSLTDTLEIATGANHALGLREGGALVAWGWDYLGQLGRGQKKEEEEEYEEKEKKESGPFLIFPQDCRAMASSIHCSFALMNDGTLISWGDNGNCQRGIEQPDSETPQEVTFPKIIPISCFGCTLRQCFLICENGDLYLWGSTGDEVKKVPTIFQYWKWELPKSYIWNYWKSVFRWLFLGRCDEGSPFKHFHVEIIFNFVTIF
jgi:hypothetical protein